MQDCQFKSRLSAYHDAELSAAETEAVNEHLPTCETCSSELGTIREVSAALSTYEPETISQIELARLHRAIDRVDDRGLIRLAGMLSAVAASVLIICMAWMSQSSLPATIVQHPDALRVPAWEKLALGGQPEVPGMPRDIHSGEAPDSGFAIDFMLQGIQGSSGHESR
jgi:anti-sigma factor RsiW